MAPAARFRCNDHAAGGYVGAKDRRYTPAGENTVGVSRAWSQTRKESAACSPRDVPMQARSLGAVEPKRFPLSDRERPTGVPANYGSVINRDYRSSRNAFDGNASLHRFSGRAEVSR